MTPTSTPPLPIFEAVKPPMWAILIALVYPTLLTLIYFQWLEGSSAGLQQAVYGVGKVIQFVIPVAVVWSLQRSRTGNETSRFGAYPIERVTPRISQRTSLFPDTPRNSFTLGVVFGIGVVVTMMLVYFGILPAEVRDSLNDVVKAKVASLGVGTPIRFIALSLFYVVGHSFLEEYYWRWFVFNALQQRGAVWRASLVAAIGFMAHHVVLLGFFFGWTSPLTYVISASVAVGGIFWAWLFNRQFGFRSAWISHAIVDAGIFSLGMLILQK